MLLLPAHTCEANVIWICLSVLLFGSQFCAMPPRRHSHLKGLPLTLASAAESLEAKVKRLRPELLSNDSTPMVESRAGTPHGVASSSRGVQAHTAIGLWHDAPVVRNVSTNLFLANTALNAPLCALVFV
jgi:hypothetical protein